MNFIYHHLLQSNKMGTRFNFYCYLKILKSFLFLFIHAQKLSWFKNLILQNIDFQLIETKFSFLIKTNIFSCHQYALIVIAKPKVTKVFS